MISVIVPVYKVEKYLHKCIESILEQSYKDYELILVDDGSPDDCPDICDFYAEQYSNIIVIHKENGGLSDARNAGIKIARGEYITFIDSDDYVDQNYLITLISLLEKYDADISVTGIKTFYENEVIPQKNGIIREYVYTGMEALEKMLYQKTLDSSACAMLLPTKLARQFLFPYRKYHEDEFTTYKYYASVNKVAVTTRPQYFYFQRRNSIMHTFGQASLDELDAADNLVNVCGEYWPDLIKAAKAKKFSDYCQVLLSSNAVRAENPVIFSRIVCYLNNEKKKIICNPNVRIKNRVAAALLYVGVNALVMVNKLVK